MYCTEIAKFLAIRKSAIVRNTQYAPLTISRPNTMLQLPNTPPKQETDKSLLSSMLRSLRLAVTPSYDYGTNIYKENTSTNKNKSTLAGNPRQLSCCQNIRAEILEKWNKRPQTDIQKEWLKNIVFN